MNDFEVLGINKDCSLMELKKAFRLKSKEYHPDKNKDSYISHLAMIRLNQAYSNINKLLKDLSSFQKEPGDDEKAYNIYKEGITFFQKIHPSQWKKMNDIYNSHAIETDPDIITILNKLIDSIALAYQSFSKIICEFPNSCWYNDSKLKIQELEKMTIRYSKIRESYKKEISDLEKMNKAKG